LFENNEDQFLIDYLFEDNEDMVDEDGARHHIEDVQGTNDLAEEEHTGDNDIDDLDINDPVLSGALPQQLFAKRLLGAGDSVYLDKHTEIREALKKKTFDPTKYEHLRVLKSGEPFFKEIHTPDGTLAGLQLKVLRIDYEDWNTLLEVPVVQEHIDALAEHVQGEYQDGKAVSGFMKIKPHLASNRDGKNTAFTTFLTLYGGHTVFPVLHSTGEKGGVAEFMRNFHCLLEDLCGSAMDATMSQDFKEFCKERKQALVVPCFGRDIDTQSYFTSAQINCSDGRRHVEGKARDIHSDDGDSRRIHLVTEHLSVPKRNTKNVITLCRSRIR
jgi:hypothetical protein